MLVYKLIHLLAALVWVGGMLFAYMILRPAAVEVLEPPPRLRLWNAVFRRFFPWVWGSIVVLLFTGFYLIHLYGGMAHVGRHVHIMLLMGMVMILIFIYVYFACYKPLGQNIAEQRWKEAGEYLAKIRGLIAVNLSLGILLVCEVFVVPALF